VQVKGSQCKGGDDPVEMRPNPLGQEILATQALLFQYSVRRAGSWTSKLAAAATSRSRSLAVNN